MKIDTSELTFHTPPVCQGQAVTRSYAAYKADESKACIIRSRSESGEPTEYKLFEDPEWENEHSTNLEFWNQEPKLGSPVLAWTESAE